MNKEEGKDSGLDSQGEGQKESEVKKCPDCGSTNLILWVGGSTGSVYRCVECGYIGNAQVIDGDISEGMKQDLDEFKKEIERDKS